MSAIFKRFIRDTSGATVVEYALIGSLISIAILIGATSIGTSLNTMFQDVTNQINP